MSYLYDYAIAIIENKDINAAEKYLDTILTEYLQSDKYRDTADWLTDKLDIKDVKFNSAVFANVAGTKYFFDIFNINTNDTDTLLKYADLLIQYDDELGLNENVMLKINETRLLLDFKKNYKKIKERKSYSDMDSELIAHIINDVDYDPTNREQVGLLAAMVYYNFSDKAPDLVDNIGSYPMTRLLNQLALNADLDETVMDTIEANCAGWYAENIDAQLELVDMSDFSKEIKKAEIKNKAANKLTKEHIEMYKREWAGILVFTYYPGFTGLENQINDRLVIEFDDKVVYTDDGFNNSFGDVSLRKDKVDRFLETEGQGFRNIKALFLF